jgi:uncharacterized membrane protein
MDTTNNMNAGVTNTPNLNSNVNMDRENHGLKQNMGGLVEKARNLMPARPHNVGQTERWVSGVAGGLLVLYAIRNRRSWLARTLGATGLNLIYRGASGYCTIYNRFGVNTAR